MSKAILLCGKIGSGKTFYAEALCKREGAVLLSADELMLTLFGPFCGDRHEELSEKTRRFLYALSLRILSSGVSVVLDWGFWTKAGREEARQFYESRGILCELHFLAVSEARRLSRIRKRNREVAEGKTLAYPVDSGLEAKGNALFEPPAREEIDVWVEEDGAAPGDGE